MSYVIQEKSSTGNHFSVTVACGNSDKCVTIADFASRKLENRQCNLTLGIKVFSLGLRTLLVDNTRAIEDSMDAVK